jgi:hypothetical protein
MDGCPVRPGIEPGTSWALGLEANVLKVYSHENIITTTPTSGGYLFSKHE